MKILLTNIYNNKIKYYFDFTTDNPYEHIGLEYLFSTLFNKGYNVKCIYLNLSKANILSFIKTVISFKPALIGFTIDSYNLKSIICLTKHIKRQYKTIHITLGGHLATCAAYDVLKDNPQVDSIILGYGEDTICELADKIFNKEDINNIPGLLTNNNCNLINYIKRKTEININTIPFPHRSLKGNVFSTRMISSRGCSYNCSFCTTPIFLNSICGNKWVPRQPSYIVNEIISLKNEHHIKAIIFNDDNFIGPGISGIQRVRKIINQLKPLDINYWIMCRVDSFINNEDIIDKLIDSGLWGILFGVEAGDMQQLSIFNKGVNVADNVKYVKLFKKKNVVVELGFIMFHPYSTMDGIISNVSFLNDIGESNIFKYYTTKLELYPGIRIIDSLRKDGLLLDNYIYTSIYGYKYQSANVEKLLQLLEKIGEQLVIYDEIIWNYKRLTSILGLFNKTQHNKNNLYFDVERLKKSIDNTIEKVGEINNTNVISYINLEKTGYSTINRKQNFNNHKSDIRNEIKISLSSLNELKTVNKHIDDDKLREVINMFFMSGIYKKMVKLLC